MSRRFAARWRRGAGRSCLPVLLAVAATMLSSGPEAVAHGTEEHAAENGAALSDPLPPGFSVGGPFALVDHTGRARTDADFRGAYMLIYFGYTNCPDVCPVDLQRMSAAIDHLGPAGEVIQPLFVSVDPKRDTVEVLADYVSRFHPRLIGLTGPLDDVRNAAKGYRIHRRQAKSALDPDAYYVDHTPFIFLMGRDGAFLTMFIPGTPAREMAETLRKYVK